MRSKLPWGRKPEKPGAGLSQMFPAKDFADEATTGKMPVIAEALEKCPRCAGKILLVAEPVDPSDAPVDLSQHGAFRAEWCGYCASSNGRVTAAEADLIREAMKSQ